MKSVWVSSRNDFLEECLTLKIASFSFRFLNESCAVIAENALERDSGEVSVGKVSMVEFGAEERRESAREDSLSGLRARRATARLP